ncbi:Gfo/Idh/MocA family oxidoreductase [Bacillus sp. APMAM]|nr:Gfo/Idh/MocA family oxidoreductase [Bacillus sp. APMAM]RTZ55018.1 Gfo/Idh/MocA family oxidoreductase [Bacillus sp. SAJ1]
MNRLKVGVIGTGSMGRHHTRIYDSLTHEVQLIGVYDNDKRLSKEIANQYRIKCFEDINDLLSECDAVSIAVPTICHYEVAMRALELNTHILIEKPISSSIFQAKEIMNLSDSKGLTVQVGHVERFNPAIIELNKLLTDQNPVGVDIKRLSPYDGRITDVDVIQDLMIHDIDIILNLFGNNICEINGIGKSVFSEKNLIDYAVASIQFSNGIIANLTASRVTQEKIRKLGLTTESSYIDLDYLDKKISIFQWTNMQESINSRDVTYRQESVVSRVFVPNEEPLLNEIKSFIKSVKNNIVPVVTAFDGLISLEVCERIRENIYNKIDSEKYFSPIGVV